MKLDSAGPTILAKGVAVAATVVVMHGCGERAPEKMTVKSPPSQPAPPAASPAAKPAISGEFRLVKSAASASVFVVKDGKKIAISNWGWVERNAPGKPIETVSQAELDALPPTGVTFE